MSITIPTDNRSVCHGLVLRVHGSGLVLLADVIVYCQLSGAVNLAVLAFSQCV